VLVTLHAVCLCCSFVYAGVLLSMLTGPELVNSCLSKLSFLFSLFSTSTQLVVVSRGSEKYQNFISLLPLYSIIFRPTSITRM